MDNRKIASELVRLAKEISSTSVEKIEFFYYDASRIIEINCTIMPSYKDTMSTIHKTMKEMESDVKKAIKDGRNYGIVGFKPKIKEWTWGISGFNISWEAEISKATARPDEIFAVLKKYGIKQA